MTEQAKSLARPDLAFTKESLAKTQTGKKLTRVDLKKLWAPLQEGIISIGYSIRPMWLECRFRTATCWEVLDRYPEALTKQLSMKKEAGTPRDKSCSITWDLGK